MLLGVRPHQLEVDAEDGQIRATVKVVEPTGVETFVFSDFEGQEIACQMPRRAAPRLRDEIRLSPSRDAILLFDKETGNRVH